MVMNTKNEKGSTVKKRATNKIKKIENSNKKTITNTKGVEMPPPNPRGRPTTYNPQFCEVVIEEMSKGYSKEAVAGTLGISKNTLYQWAERYADFKDAIAIGETKSQVFWEKKLVDYAVHTKNGMQINGQVFNLNMKNRFGWKDKNEVSLDEPTRKSFTFALDQKPEEIN